MSPYLNGIYLNVKIKNKEGVTQKSRFQRNKILSSQRPLYLGEIVLFG